MSGYCYGYWRINLNVQVEFKFRLNLLRSLLHQCLWESLPTLGINSRVDWYLHPNLEMPTWNQSIIISKKAWQFPDHEENKSVQIHNLLPSAGIGYLKKRTKVTQTNLRGSTINHYSWFEGRTCSVIYSE